MPSFYGYDGHGSVRQLTNSTGAVTDTYDYDAFGNLINQTGSTPNNYLFAGEQYDPALALYYNRARYLDTTTGRFWGMDTYEGDNYAPRSLHKYLYLSSNPVDRRDPSGHGNLVELSIAFAVNAVENAFSFLIIGGLNYVFTNRLQRGNIIQKYIFPAYRAAGFRCNQWIGTTANPPINKYRPNMYYPGRGLPYEGEIYEIKSSDPGQMAEGLADLAFYKGELSKRTPGIGWRLGSYLLCPPKLRVPEFPFIEFYIELKAPGLVTYTPTPDTERALEAGAVASALQIFFLMESTEAPAEPVPEEGPGPGTGGGEPPQPIDQPPPPIDLPKAA
ncbi:MAG TPA: RHS repeat-associated core domain-containing protein [Candidatus Sulfotelmatobacter sp.]|nr:RHS repeat-associated core domain-containing protein [Candidatus Sulfotelmatobacter sp.]